MRFTEINLFGVYVAPISVMMVAAWVVAAWVVAAWVVAAWVVAAWVVAAWVVAAWVVTIGLRRLAARFGLCAMFGTQLSSYSRST